MNFFLFFAVPLLGYSLHNFHRAFLWYFLFRIVINEFVPFFIIDGFPIIRMGFFCDFWFILLTVLKYIKKNGSFKMPRIKPEIRPFIWMVLLIMLSSAMSFLPFFNSMSCAALECITSYLFPLLFVTQVKRTKDLQFVITGLMIVCVIAAIYGIIEAFVFRYTNPLVVYEQFLNPNIKEATWVYDAFDRGGRGRVSSFFSHAIGCGCTMSIFTVFFFYIKVAHEKYIVSNKLFYVAIFSAVLLMGLSNSRSPYPMLLISFLAFWKSKLFLKLVAAGMILFVIFHTELSSFIDLFLSIFDKKIESSMGGGSNIEMRMKQFEALFRAWNSGNPIIGEGAYATRYWLGRKIGLLGGESIWISLLLNTGLLGCFLYLYIMKNLILFSRVHGKRMLFFFVVGWVVMNSATSTPGLDVSLFFMIAFCIAKLDMLNESCFEKACYENS